MLFSLLDLEMNGTNEWYEFHPPHLIAVATLPWESRNPENVIFQLDVTKKLHLKYHSFIEMEH